MMEVNYPQDQDASRGFMVSKLGLSTIAFEFDFH